MSLWDKLEQSLEALVEGTFARAFKGRVHPLEIARGLAREIEDKRTISVSTVYVPNDFTVLLHPDDLAQLLPLGDDLRRELEAHVREYIEERQYRTVGRPRVTLQGDPAQRVGFRVRSETVDRAPEGQLIGLSGLVAGKTFELTAPVTTLGRSGECEIMLSDSNVSRTHAQVVAGPEGFWIVDLGSTNGTWVNGRRVEREELQDGDEITVGLCSFRFRER